MSLSSTYREHMRRYAQDTAYLSFIKTDHCDYADLVKMGDDIVPLLIEDIARLEDPLNPVNWRDVRPIGGFIWACGFPSARSIICSTMTDPSGDTTSISRCSTGSSGR